MNTFALRSCATVLAALAVFSSTWTAFAWVSEPGMVSQIPASEYGVLLDLYKNNGGPAWFDNGGWTNPEAATWDGVTVLNGHVAYIELSDNQLTGAVPANLGNLTQLQYLDLSVNALSGQIPDNWTNLSQLFGLYLNNNALTGRIPPSLLHLPLQYLDVSFNQLTGPIPKDIGCMCQAQTLDFGYNEFCGCIPCDVTNLIQLTFLGFAANRLEGEIPSGVGNLTQAQTLDFSYNRLHGTIPPSLGNDTDLTYLDLSGNEFTGPIPSTLGNLPSLQELYLENNWLGGSIPSSLGNLSSLDYLLLDSNRFTGVVPDFTGFSGVYIGLTKNYFNLPAGSASMTHITDMINAGNTVNYSPQDPAPLWGSLRYNFGGLVQLPAIGLDAQYTVQESSDLKHWSNIGSLSISNNSGIFQETAPTSRAPNFFRLSIVTTF